MQPTQRQGDAAADETPMLLLAALLGAGNASAGHMRIRNGGLGSIDTAGLLYRKGESTHKGKWSEWSEWRWSQLHVVPPDCVQGARAVTG